MFGIASIVLLALSLILELGGLGKGDLNWQALMLAGLLCPAVHVATGTGWPWRKA